MGNLKWVLISSILVGCRGNQVPTNVQTSQSTTIVPSGKTKMFGDTAFIVYVPILEVQMYEVTNASFEEFVTKTGYITTAERSGEGMVFDESFHQWKLVKGADWKHPLGPKSDIAKKKFHPVVQVSHKDACTYCEWINMRLPTEAEWEHIYAIESLKPPPASNHWQGIFPIEDKGEDGYKGTSPVGKFGKGFSGCFDLSGNVWEWCSDFYQPFWPEQGKLLNDSLRYFGPLFPNRGISISDTVRVIKGGSYLCADNFCKGYLNQIRMSGDANMGYSHTGFRCVKNR